MRAPVEIVELYRQLRAGFREPATAVLGPCERAALDCDPVTWFCWAMIHGGEWGRGVMRAQVLYSEEHVNDYDYLSDAFLSSIPVDRVRDFVVRQGGTLVHVNGLGEIYSAPSGQLFSVALPVADDYGRCVLWILKAVAERTGRKIPDVLRDMVSANSPALSAYLDLEGTMFRARRAGAESVEDAVTAAMDAVWLDLSADDRTFLNGRDDPESTPF